MSRSVSWVGLNDRAYNLLKSNKRTYTETIVRVYDDNGEIQKCIKIGIDPNYIEKKYDEYECFYDIYPLMQYIVPDGVEYFEFIQSDPWDSGPSVFTALRDKDNNPIKETLWTEKEICEHMDWECEKNDDKRIESKE